MHRRSGATRGKQELDVSFTGLFFCYPPKVGKLFFWRLLAYHYGHNGIKMLVTYLLNCKVVCVAGEKEARTREKRGGLGAMDVPIPQSPIFSRVLASLPLPRLCLLCWLLVKGNIQLPFAICCSRASVLKFPNS